MNDHTVLFLAYVVILILVGLILLSMPRRIQKIAESSVHVGPTGKSERLSSLVSSFVTSDAFVWNLRAVGVLALLMAAFMIWASLRS